MPFDMLGILIRRKKEEGRRKKEEGRGKREEGRGNKTLRLRSGNRWRFVNPRPFDYAHDPNSSTLSGVEGSKGRE
ncbi:MAG: hypothetical protein EAZ09_09160 [Oscillatoriales cyanobacterium]|nr:MAG: hypothetical protein EAZ18_08280 [Oscillatoriales cyanobacterium]TAH22897.1 MAG: hypothetical protein EAZ09_09160 [Oscillatoriales cyanobacterium]